eukprot:741226-Pelagomonas_calceolata.AAC.1
MYDVEGGVPSVKPEHERGKEADYSNKVRSEAKSDFCREIQHKVEWMAGAITVGRQLRHWHWLPGFASQIPTFADCSWWVPRRCVSLNAYTLRGTAKIVDLSRSGGGLKSSLRW